MFLAMTRGLDDATRRRIALMVVLVSFAILLFFIAVGGFLLENLGVSLRAFQIAGDLVLFPVALDMVRRTGPAQPPPCPRKIRSRSLSIPLASRRSRAQLSCSRSCC
jgi:small neutral amino acid transporter SnatA (MarC family)